jgi:hypothetical protein
MNILYKNLFVEFVLINIFVLVLTNVYVRLFSNIINTEWTLINNCNVINETKKIINTNDCYTGIQIKSQIINWYVRVDNVTALSCASYYAESSLYCTWNGYDRIIQSSTELNNVPAILCSRCMDYMCSDYFNYSNNKCYVTTKPWNNYKYIAKWNTKPYFPTIQYYVSLLIPFVATIIMEIVITTVFLIRIINIADNTDIDNYKVNINTYLMIICWRYIIPILFGIFLTNELTINYYSGKNNVILITILFFWLCGICNHIIIIVNAIRLRSNSEWIETLIPIIGLCALKDHNEERKIKNAFLYKYLLCLYIFTNYLHQLVLLSMYLRSYGSNNIAFALISLICYVLISFIAHYVF